MRSNLCSKCGNEHDRNGRYCRACHNAYMREWRQGHPLEGDARKRQNARSHARVYLARGLIVREPCRACGSPDAEMHHEDYDKPVEIVWLCRPCHLKHHREVA